jgi:hypothetical protein
MDLKTREHELRQQFEANQVQFLLTELDTAITFCNVAKSATEPEKAERNTCNALEGYDVLQKFAPGAHFDAESKSRFDEKFAELKSLLTELGQQV